MPKLKNKILIGVLLFSCFGAKTVLAGDEEVGGDGPSRLVLGTGEGSSAGGKGLEADEFSGAATYSIAIPVPPGRGNLQPNLNLVYNSQLRNRDSWVGNGWSLDLGLISRTPGNHGLYDFQNGTSFDVHFGGTSESLKLSESSVDPADYGLASGNRVEKYESKIESAFNIYLHLVNESDVDHPEDRGWVVIDKSGRRYEFGKTEAGRDTDGEGHVAQWFLEKVTDANGNTLEVEYDALTHCPHFITYQDIRIDFDVQETGRDLSESLPIRPLFREAQFGTEHLGKKLMNITISSDGTRLQKFSFRYQPSIVETGVPYDAPHAPFLSRIQQYGRTDAMVLPATDLDYWGTVREGAATAFSWSTASTDYQATRTPRSGDTNKGFLNNYTDLIDMNGDGLPDQVVGFRDTNNIYIYLNNGSGFESTPQIWSDPLNLTGCGGDPENEIVYCIGRLNAYYPGIQKQFVYLMDMNGDSLPDRVQVVAREGGSASLFIFFNSGSGWIREEIWDDPYTGDWSGTSDSTKGFMDMNGDGLVDRIVGYKSRGEFEVFYNTGSGFQTTPVIWADPINTVSPGNDAIGHLIGKEDDSSKVYAFIRDMNGDGLPDRFFYRTFLNEEGREQLGFLVFMNIQGQRWGQAVRDEHDYWVGNGIDSWTIFDPIEEDGNKGYLTRRHDWIDFNADGLLDRIEGNADTGIFKVHICSGSVISGRVLFGQTVQMTDPIEDTSDKSGRGYVRRGKAEFESGANWHSFILDLDGDGYPDRVEVNPRGGDDSKVYKISSLRSNAITFSDIPGVQINQPFGALKHIDDGAGSQMAIEYIPSSRPLRWPARNNRFLPFNLYLAHKIYSSDYSLPRLSDSIPEANRNPGMRWTTYDYSGGNFYVRYPDSSSSYYAQFNGFQKVKHTVFKAPGETWNNFSTTTFYHQSLGDAFFQPLGSVEAEGLRHFALSGRPYRQEINETGGSQITEKTTWSVNGYGPSNSQCDGTCFPKLDEKEKTVLETPTSPLRKSRIAYHYDDVGNVTSEINYGSSGDEILSKITSYHPRTDFDRTLWIRDSPFEQSQQAGGTIVRKKIFNYDERGNPREEKFLISGSPERYSTITRTFYPNGNLHEITDVDGITKTLSYDSDNLFPVTEITASGSVSLTTTRQFDRLTGDISSETGPSGTGTKKEYDDFGRPVREIIRASNGDETIAREYDYSYWPQAINFNGVSRSTKLFRKRVWDRQAGYPDTNTNPVQITYSDSSGNVVQQCNRALEGNYRVVWHKMSQAGREDAQTEPIEQEDCSFRGTISDSARLYKTKKDFQGRTTYVDPPPGDAASPIGEATISYSTNADGHLVKNSSFPNGQSKQEIFNETERLATVKDSNNSPLRYEYNDAGDLRHVYGINDELLTTIEYDLLGRKTRMIDADMGTWAYDYDSFGRLEWQTDAKNQKTHYFYTSLGRVERKEYLKSDGSVEKYEVYTYDAGDSDHNVRPGELFKVEEYSADGTLLRRTLFGYDSLYRRTSKLSRYIPGIGDFEQTLSYDAKGLLQNTVYPSGQGLYYRYSRLGSLTNVCANESCDPTRGEVYYSINPDTDYDSFGNLLKETYGNGVISEHQYYPQSHRLQERKISKGSTIYSQRTYEYDAFSNITAIGDPLHSQGSGAMDSVGYDSLNRLTSYGNTGSIVNLEYDNRGNLKKFPATHGDSEYHYDLPAHPHAVSSIGDATFAYDDNGNMTSDSGRQMTYNTQNQLVHVAMTNGVAVDYDYDYTGARVSKKVRREDPLHQIHEATTNYLGDVLEIKGDRLILHISANGQRIATKSLGAINDIIGAGAGTLRHTGITPEWNSLMLAPYLFLFFALFIIASFRPIRRLKISSPRIQIFPLPLGERVRVRGAFAMAIRLINGWASYTSSLREALHALCYRPCIKFVSLLLIFLSFAEFPLQAMAVPGETVPDSISDADYFYYEHGDNLGSSHILTEGKPESRHSGITYQKGDILQRFEYAPFGKETFVLNPNLKFDPSYTGQTYDIETGLYFYKSRYYDPTLGRFIQPDTMVPDGKNLQDYNRYTYVNNNPLKYIDPSGHSFIDFFHKFMIGFMTAVLAVMTAGVLTLAGMGPLMATIFGGMVAGAYGAALSGAGWKGALLGGIIGGITAGLGYGGNNLLKDLGVKNLMTRFAIMASAGAGLSYGTGGWNGFISFVGGMAATLPLFLGATRAGPIERSISSHKGEYAQGYAPYDGENKPLEGMGRPAGGSGEYYRYVGPAEAADIQRTGIIPNTRPTPEGPVQKNVFYTNQHFDSAVEAQQTLNLPTTPTHSVTIDSVNVRANYGGTTEYGGTEFMTRQSIQVDPLRVDILK